MNKFWFMVVSLTMFVFLHINSYGQIITGDSLDPNVLWKTNDTLGGFTGFQIHPNGNIIANRNCEFFEIDGKTGQRIRSFPVIYGYSGVEDAVTVSKDGKYFAACFVASSSETTTDIYIFDYETGNVVKKLVNYGEALCFLNDSKRLIIRAYKGSLTIYDIEKDTSYYNGADQYVEVITVSDDGKLIATGGVSHKLEDGKQYSIIKLWDANTLQLIHEFKMKEGTNSSGSIKFSSDSKFIGCQVSWADLFIYRTDDFSLFKHYSESNTNGGVYGFCFIDNNFIGVRTINASIIRFSDDKQIFSKYLWGGAYSILDQNISNNSLVVSSGYLIAFDLNRIFTSVKDDSKNQKITATYYNNILSIDNLILVSTNPKITISDINGKIIKQMDLPLSNLGIKIPIKLISGIYLIDITDGKTYYSTKFIVTK